MPMTATILIVDSAAEQRRVTEYAITQKLRYQAVTAENEKEAVTLVANGGQPRPDLVLLDLTMPAATGIIKAIKACRPHLPVIVFVPYGEDACVVEAVSAGACDFLTKPMAIDRLRLSIHNTLKYERMARYVDYLEHRQAGRAGFSDIVGESPAIALMLAAAKAAGASPLPVWIKGEAGVGKELLARAMHSSGCSGKPFIAVDCAGLEQDTPGAGTAPQEKLAASLQEAENGTLFLRDIGMASLPLQQWLLNGMADKPVRLICSSASDASALAAQGWLHQGLLQRIKATIEVPPLRDRRQDIPLLAKHFISRYAASERKSIYGLAPDAAGYLTAAPWPGNVRQLASLLWRAVMICNQDLLDAGNIRLIQQWQPAYYQPQAGEVVAPALVDDHGRVKKLRVIEEDAIRLALHHAGGSMTRAARSLGIGRSTLYRRVHDLEISGYISRANQTTRPMMEASSTPRS